MAKVFSDRARRLLPSLRALAVRDQGALRKRLRWLDNYESDIDPVFAFVLEDDEIELLSEWFRETNDAPLIGEVGFVAASLLTDLILSNRIMNVVQIGHYAGFSSLILGMVMRKLGQEARLVSFDIDSRVTEFCQDWMKKAGLADIVQHYCVNSTDPTTLDLAGYHLDGPPGLLFIDGSKQYHNTIAEARLWRDHLNGFVVAHDVSVFAKEGYREKHRPGFSKGVGEGLIDSECFHPGELLIVDPGAVGAGFPYLDQCGLGIGMMRGTAPLARTSDPDRLLRRRQIVPRTMLESVDDWTLGSGFSAYEGNMVRVAGQEGFASCYAPIESGQILRVELVVSKANGQPIVVCGGGNPGSSAVFHGDGLHTGTFVVGGENSLVAIYAPETSAFTIEMIQVVIHDG